MLYAWEGNTLVASFVVSTGTWEHPTVTGDYHVYARYKYTDMSGPGYYLPDVPNTQYFYQGYAIHGTYWHNNFGHPMSHGCVNMKATDVAKLYDWATPVSTGNSTHSTKMNPGTKITIHDGESEINVSP